MEKSVKPFTAAARLKSFRYAIHGISKVLRYEQNAWIHMVAALLVIVSGLILQISITEWVGIFICIGMVMTTEILNTALERMVDLMSPDKDEKAGMIKDMSAGAVLVAAIISVIVGMIIFLPHIAKLCKPVV